jgi:hypothetical protein
MVIISQEDFKPNVFWLQVREANFKKKKIKESILLSFLVTCYLLEHIVLLYGDYQNRKEA